MARKEFRGRQKIKMAKIENRSHREVTFSKRRLGVFKKASEICTLCGAEIIIIVYSPSHKIFSYGNPNVESILSRYLTRNPCPQTSSSSTKVPQNSTINELNSKLTKILYLLEAEKIKEETFKKPRQWWWEEPIDKLSLLDLEVLSASMEELHKKIVTQAIYLENTNSSSSMLSMDNGNSNGVGVSYQHFDLKYIEDKMKGFALPNQVGSFYTQSSSKQLANNFSTNLS